MVPLWTARGSAHGCRSRPRRAPARTAGLPGRRATSTKGFHALDAFRTGHGAVLRPGVDVQAVPGLEAEVHTLAVLERDGAGDAEQDLLGAMAMPVVGLLRPARPPPRMGAVLGGEDPPHQLLVGRGSSRDPDAHGLNPPGESCSCRAARGKHAPYAGRDHFASPRPARGSAPRRVNGATRVSFHGRLD